MTKRWVVSFALAFAALAPACASAPPAPDPTAAVIIAPPPPAATSTAAATPSPAAPRGRRFVAETRPLPQDIDDDTGAAPCDFHRSYRGVIGETHLTVLLRPDPQGKLGGLVHYDRPGAGLAVTGARRGAEDFTLNEKGGGRFEGRCNATGALEGSYTLGKRKQTFSLRARPADWPAIHKLKRSATVEPNNPLCAKRAQPDSAVELESDGGRVVCLPTRPKARKALLADAPQLLCSASESGYRVFGLPDPEVEKRVNSALSLGWFDFAAKDIQRCSYLVQTDMSVGLVAARRDLLVITTFRSTDHGGAHPMNSGGGGVAIDLVRGATIALDDLVDPARLRDMTLACLPFYGATQAGKRDITISGPLPPAGCGNQPSMGRLLWSCDKDDRKSPEWSLVPEGVVIGSWGNPHVTAALDGRGPVLPWSVLLRDNALRRDSKVASLWAGVTAAPSDAPACPMSYLGSSLEVWREVPP